MGVNMKIAILSDIHGNLPALESIIKDLREQKADRIVFLGDLVMTGPRPSEVFRLLAELHPDIWIRGNTDEWITEADDFHPRTDQEKLIKEITLWARDRLSGEQQQFLLDRKIYEEKVYGGFTIGFCHGSPKSSSERLLPDSDSAFLSEELEESTARIILCGHTHLRFTLHHNNGIIKNFGSVSLPVSDHSRYGRYGILHIGDTVGFEDRDCEYDLEKFLKDIERVDYPGKSMILPKYGI